MGSKRTLTEEISWKGIGDYLSAARTLSENGSDNTSGPRLHCQGLALELAFKFYLWNTVGEYPGIHDLEYLAFEKCQAVKFSVEEKSRIESLNKQYLRDGVFPYPARYRPDSLRVFSSPSQTAVVGLVSKLIRATSQPALLDRILSR